MPEDLPLWVKTSFGVLCSVIGIMAAGFRHVYYEVKKERDELKEENKRLTDKAFVEKAETVEFLKSEIESLKTKKT